MWIDADGNEKNEISYIQYVRWVKDGIAKRLMENRYGDEKDEFIDIAREVIV